MQRHGPGWKYSYRAYRRLSRAAALFLALASGGCMTLGGRPPPPAADIPASRTVHADELAPAARPVPEPRPRKPARVRKAPVARPAPEKTAIDPDRLIGMTPAGVRGLLGPPTRIRDQDLSREWVYAARDCSLRVIFYPNLNAAAFRVLKYGGSNGNGELLDVSDVCIRNILAAKNVAAKKPDREENNAD